MNNNQRVVFAALLCMAATGACAQGAPHRWYVGLDYGDSQLDADDDAPAAVDRDDSSDAWAVRFGYRFTRYFALEAGYTDIGDFFASYSPACAPGPFCQPYDTTASIQGILVNSLFTWPAAKHFHVKGSLGAIYREFDATFTSPTTNVSSSDTSTVWSFGVGIAVPINERFEIDLDYTHYREIGLGLTLSSSLGVIDEGESSVTTLGVRFRF